MQRTKKATEENPHEGQVYFIKKGGGSLRLASGRIIKPKQSFWAFADEIPEAFRDNIVPVEGGWDGVEETLEKEVVQNAPIFRLKRRGGSKYYDVINEEGKVINEERLEKEAADELLKTLN